MKADTLLAAAVAASAACSTTNAFQSNFHHHAISSSSIAASSPLFAEKKENGGNNPEKEPKYSINDKSYGTSPSISSSSSEQNMEEAQSSMADFFTTYSDWKPLFRNIMSNNDGTVVDTTTNSPPLASSFLADTQHPQDLWGISTIELRNPWRLLSSKPTSNSSLETLSTFLDEWQQSLLDIPLDSIVTGDNDMHFLEEGRRTIAVTRFHVLDDDHATNPGSVSEEEEYDWERELFRTCWSEMAHLMSQDDNDTGSLVLLPDHDVIAGKEERGMEYVREFVEDKLLRPMQWLGRQEDWEIVAMERGSLAVRLLYKLSDMPDLSERDSGGDENVKLL